MKERLEAIITEMVDKGIRLDLARDDFERKFLQIALERYRGSRKATARALGVHRNTLGHKIAKYRIKRRSGSP
ncbi:MAG: helix-turn-helix domain-containing protein [Acidobacteriota bacterium]